MKHNYSIHQQHTKNISLHPSIIGIDGIVLSCQDANIFQGKNDLYHQPDDLLFDPTTHKLYNIEYKCGEQRDKAVHQLKESSLVLQKCFREYDIISLYVHNNYVVERIK